MLLIHFFIAQNFIHYEEIILIFNRVVNKGTVYRYKGQAISILCFLGMDINLLTLF